MLLQPCDDCRHWYAAVSVDLLAHSFDNGDGSVESEECGDLFRSGNNWHTVLVGNDCQSDCRGEPVPEANKRVGVEILAVRFDELLLPGN